MDYEELDSLAYSHQKLSELLENVTDSGKRDKIVTDFIESSKTQCLEDFHKDFEWFNVSEPISFKKHLKGKLVVLDFFTYCCINCMHILPDLKAIEKEFSIEDGLVVIGVHSAKFDNEKNSINIRAAVQRYNISHPVVNDSDAVMWNKCEVSCWPTLLLVGPNANPIIMMMGEGHRDDLRFYVKNALKYYKSKNEISDHQLPIKPSFHLLPELKGPLLFPGKITSYIDNDNNNVEKLAISDTGNHRILIILPNGTIIFQIGGGIGFKDGSLDQARFNSPQGVCFQNEHTVFVADTENHAIRKIDLKNCIVTTVAGTGVQGIDTTGGKIGLQQEISSPWDICIFKTPDMDMTFHLPDENIIKKDVLIIAMAGTHQIWALFFEDTIWWKFKKYPKGSCVCIAGSGKEENRNNAYPQTASFAQPSGLVLNKEKKELYIADSESSSIRRLSLIDGKVTGIVGGDRNPNNLFAFGDLDGKLCEAKLQHVLGVCMSKDENILYVADTYNHKLKKINLATNTISTIHTSDNSFSKDLNFKFNEPSGLCVSGDGSKLYVTDTNNHCIKVVHMNDDHSILKLNRMMLRSDDKRQIKFDKAKSIVLGKNFYVNIKGGKIILSSKFLFRDDIKLTTNAPQKWSVLVPNETWACVPQSGSDINNMDSVISLPALTTTRLLKFYVEFNFITCKDVTCLPKMFAIECTVEYDDRGPTQLQESLEISIGSSVITIN